MYVLAVSENWAGNIEPIKAKVKYKKYYQVLMLVSLLG